MNEKEKVIYNRIKGYLKIFDKDLRDAREFISKIIKNLQEIHSNIRTFDMNLVLKKMFEEVS